MLLLIQFFTKIPINKSLDCETSDFRKSLWFLPVLGGLIGAVQGLVFYLSSMLFPVSIAIIFAMVTEYIVTGGFHMDGYDEIEMEAGPYLCAIYEDLYPERYPLKTSINLQVDDAYDIGILHYVSDTPYSKRKSLLSDGLGFTGIEATYACTIAILRRIFEREIQRVQEEQKDG